MVVYYSYYSFIVCLWQDVLLIIAKYFIICYY